ncbi:hypothetical protein Dsin_009579 [Dipteronia sinensis]|uniref:Uncharacterized protein n=1 Tax=Dipteronia sinensis TaxID=43782 RepID=A0AAE0AS48_9ROSI|nr:hypothetical protein Dsin_009579 [Dipteronia sinensis]
MACMRYRMVNGDNPRKITEPAETEKNRIIVKTERASERVSGFMSAGFDLAVVGAPLKLWISYSSTDLLSVIAVLLCCFEQSLNLVNPSVSMRLRPRRTCSGDFHIKHRYFYLLIFLRGDFT